MIRTLLIDIVVEEDGAGSLLERNRLLLQVQARDEVSQQLTRYPSSESRGFPCRQTHNAYRAGV